MKQLWDGKLSWEVESQKQPHESSFLRLNSQKAESLLRWQPQMDLTTSLSVTVDWYKAWQNKMDMFAYSITQIENYISKK